MYPFASSHGLQLHYQSLGRCGDRSAAAAADDNKQPRPGEAETDARVLGDIATQRATPSSVPLPFFRIGFNITNGVLDFSVAD